MAEQTDRRHSDPRRNQRDHRRSQVRGSETRERDLHGDAHPRSGGHKRARVRPRLGVADGHQYRELRRCRAATNSKGLRETPKSRRLTPDKARRVQAPAGPDSTPGRRGDPRSAARMGCGVVWLRKLSRTLSRTRPQQHESPANSGDPAGTAPDLKTVRPSERSPGFESRPFRYRARFSQDAGPFGLRGRSLAWVPPPQGCRKPQSLVRGLVRGSDIQSDASEASALELVTDSTGRSFNRWARTPAPLCRCLCALAMSRVGWLSRADGLAMRHVARHVEQRPRCPWSGGLALRALTQVRARRHRRANSTASAPP